MCSQNDDPSQHDEEVDDVCPSCGADMDEDSTLAVCGACGADNTDEARREEMRDLVEWQHGLLER